MKYGLIGEKLSHSFSKEIHESLCDYEYEICELAPDEVAPFLEARDFCGINVTIPYKEKVIPYLDEITVAARKIGAVNTIKNINGKLIGDNTDFYGMREMIIRAGIEIGGKKVLILGTGGTSKTARAVCADLGAKRTMIVSRTPSENTVTYESAVQMHADADIIINTTPLGMFPNTENKPIELSAFDNLSGVIDVIYNPLRTRLILEAEENAIPSTGGLLMLILQAARAAEIFLGEPIPEEKVEAVIKNIYEAKENIVLIGMPGCGKSTIGKIIAEKTGRKLIDTDDVITDMTGCPPSKIIRSDGERFFRTIETEAIQNISKTGGNIIATGGGVVTREENIALLRQNGRIIYLDCLPSDLIPTETRPLSSTVSAIRALYEIRKPLYENAADSIVPVSRKDTPDKTAEQVLTQFSELI